MPNPGGGRNVKLDGCRPATGAGEVASKTCIKSSFSCASDWRSLCPAQLMSRMLRSTAGTILLFFRRANVRVSSSETDSAGGVIGGPAGGAKTKTEPEECLRGGFRVGGGGRGLTERSAGIGKKETPCW